MFCVIVIVVVVVATVILVIIAAGGGGWCHQWWVVDMVRGCLLLLAGGIGHGCSCHCCCWGWWWWWLMLSVVGSRGYGEGVLTIDGVGGHLHGCWVWSLSLMGVVLATTMVTGR